MKPFVGWIHNKVKEEEINSIDNGILYLKGGDLEEELNEVKRKYQLLDLKDVFEGDFFETKKVVYMPL